jgi:hypothetical protein
MTPVTVIADDQSRYYSSKLISVRENVIALHLRRAVLDSQTIDVRSRDL